MTIIFSDQPQIAVGQCQWKDQLIVALRGDGSTLSPVLFTSDCMFPIYNEHFVLKVKSAKGTSVDILKCWVDTITPEFEPGDILLLMLTDHTSMKR